MRISDWSSDVCSSDLSGLTSEPRIWKQYGERDGYPDGMSFCPNGLLWIAFWDAQCLRAFDELGQTRRELCLPVKRPTKPTFDPAGPGYVTSAKIGLDDDGVQGRIFAFEQSANGERRVGKECVSTCISRWSP